MSKRILLVPTALFVAGCLFGGNNETSTVPVTKPNDTTKTFKPIAAGTYTGDYSWIDTARHHGLESEFILDSKGNYRLFWIADSEAVYDQRGTWAMPDSNLYFRGASEAWVSSGVFSDFTKMEDDTNAVVNVTDDSFTRREYTPLRQKPYWITYKRKTYPKLVEGVYKLSKTFGTDTDAVTYLFKITLKEGKFGFSVTEDSLESFQAAANFYQVGSFLATDSNQQREIDSNKVFIDNWLTVDGTILKRLQAVSDTAFNMWNPPSFFEAGSWDHYGRHSN